MRDDSGRVGVLEVLERAVGDNPHLREAAAEDVAHQLVLGGYLEEEPSAGVVGEAMATLAAEEQAFGPDVPLEDS